MLTTRWPRLAALAALCVACSDDSQNEPTRCGFPTFAEDDENETLVSDEAWRALEDAEARIVIDDALAPQWLVPGEGETVSASSAPVFQWTPFPTARRERLPAPARPTWSKRLARLVSPIGTAWAHGPPTTGDIYLAEILAPDGDCLTAHITTKTEWPLTQTDWGIIADVAGLRARLTHAYVTQNVIRTGDGPHRAAVERSFEVGP